MEEVGDQITRFKGDLATMTSAEVVTKHVVLGPCFVLDDDTHYALRVRIASHFDVHANDVLVVGSAKLGFSIVDSKRYLPFRDSSDIDVAVVSSYLFDAIWREVFDFDVAGGAYWDKKSAFQKYLFRGWIRPDFLPDSRSFTRAGEWWEFFRKITNEELCGPYHVRGGVYKSHHFLEQYQQIAVRGCQGALKDTL